MNDQNQKAPEYADSLKGWSGSVSCGLLQLNDALKKAYEQTPNKVLSFQTVITPGIAWFFFRGGVGAPLLAFGSGVLQDAEASLSRVVSSEIHLVLGKVEGGKVRQVQRLDRYEGKATLGVDFLLPESAGTYRADGAVVLDWTHSPRYHFTRDGDDDPIMANRFVEGLKSTDEPFGMLARPTYASEMLAGARIKLQVDWASAAHRNVWAYFAFANQPAGMIPVPPLRAADSQATDTNAPWEVITLIDMAKVPGKGDLSNLYNMPYLMYPYPRLKAVSMEELEPTLVEVKHVPALVAEQSVADQAETTGSYYGINPLITIVERGGPRMSLQLEGDASNSIALRGGGKGRLEQDDGRWFYVAPPVASSAVDLDPESKTLEAAALKNSLESLLDVDVIWRQVLFTSYTAAYVVVNTLQTHYFRMHKVEGQLQLGMYYVDKSNNEQVVDPAIIQWQTLAGTGRVSPDGLFTPGLSLGGATVVLAIEPDERRWYWAVMIIPPLDVDELLQLQ